MYVKDSYVNTTKTSKYFDRLIKLGSLGAVFLVPLAMPAFQPELDYAYGEYKGFILHFAALIIVAGLTGSLIIEVVRKSGLVDGLKDALFQLLRNPHYVPAHVLFSGIIALVVAFVISTLMSPLPLVSFFGVYEEFSGSNLYDFISLSVVFFGIALKFRNTADLKLLLIALCVVGTLVAYYGLVQHFGWDGLGGRGHTSQYLFRRSPSSFGNSLNFSAFLVLTITASLSIGAILIRDRFVGLLIVVALGMQLAALWLGGSRGSYLGAVAAITTLILFVGLAYGWRGILRILFIFGLALFVVILISSFPTRQGLVGVDPVSKVLSIGDQIASITGPQDTVAPQGGLSSRSRIWATAGKLLYDPAVPQEEFLIKTELRRIYGLGPDMFVHSYPIAVSPIGFLEVQPNVHNTVLQVLVAVGLLGLVGLSIVGYGILIIAMNLITRLKRDAEIEPEVILTAVFLAMIIGKAVEMQTGVSRVSDLLPTFAVFGGLVASVYLVKYQGGRRAEVTSQNSHKTVSPSLVKAGWLMAGIASLSLILFIVVFVGWDIRRLSASVAIAGVSQSEDPVLAGHQFLESNRRAPERQQIAHRIYEVYVNEARAVLATGQVEQAKFLMMQARDVWLPLEARNPYELGAQLALAEVALTLVSWGYVEFKDEVRSRYEKIVRLNPGMPTLIETGSKAFASIGDYEMAIKLAEQVIATEDQTHGWPNAWFVKGTSKFLLGYREEGIADLLVATEKQPGSQGAKNAHSTLAKIYRDSGQIESAELHELMATQ